MLTCPSLRISLPCLNVLAIVMTNIKESKASARTNIDVETTVQNSGCRNEDIYEM